VRHKRNSSTLTSGTEMGNRNENNDSKVEGSWVYLGSANLSPSAWGHKVVTDRATKMAKLTIRNWECGIVCSAEKLGFGESWDILRKFMVFDDAVPVVQVGRPWIRDDRFQ